MSEKWTRDPIMRKAFERECLTYGKEYIEFFGVEKLSGHSILRRVWRNRYFLVQLYEEPSGFKRLTIQRCAINKDGSWVDGISWDTLMEVKSEIGYGNTWAVEVYPADDSVVNVANMRHLFLMESPPDYAWRPNPERSVDAVKEASNG